MQSAGKCGKTGERVRNAARLFLRVPAGVNALKYFLELLVSSLDHGLLEKRFRLRNRACSKKLVIGTLIRAFTCYEPA